MVDSYCTACEIRRNRRRHRQRQAEIDAAFKEIHEVANEVYDKSEDEDDIPNSATPAPRCHDHEAGASISAAGSEED